MTHRQTRSLRHEYDAYVEREIEDYKDSISRTAMLSIGDEAVASLHAREQLELGEMVLWDEVDRIVKGRLRIPTYQTWRRRRIKMIDEYRRPERWGLEPDAPLVRAIRPTGDRRVLVAGANLENTALYLAAQGCDVTAVEREADIVDRVMAAADEMGLTGLVHGCVADLARYRPVSPLDAVVFNPTAFAGLTVGERSMAIATLQRATPAGGVHLLETGGLLAPLADGVLVAPVTLDELAACYAGWELTVERIAAQSQTLLARKARR